MANIQFNSNTAKGFRATLEKYYKAMHTLADIVNECNDIVNSRTSVITTDRDLLSKIEQGESIRQSKSDLEAEIASAEAKIANARADRDDAKAKQKAFIDNAQSLYTDAMHKGAETAVKTFGLDMSAWHTALADMLKANGLADATPENVTRFDFLVSVRVNPSRKIYKENTLVGASAKATSAKIFLCAFSEYLVSEKIISPFKHKYVPLSERKNQQNQ